MESKTGTMPNTSAMPPRPDQKPPLPDEVPPAPGEIVSATPVLSIPPLPEHVANPPQPLCDWWGKPITPGPLAGQCRPGIDLAWDGYEEAPECQEATIAALKHQLANSEQATQFAADLLKKAEKADPKALPRTTNNTRKLQKQIDLARSYLSAVVPPLPLEQQCKVLAERYEAEQHARVAAEGKLMAANQMIDDLVKAAGSPVVN